jgi:hypothetical protein
MKTVVYKVREREKKYLKERSLWAIFKRNSNYTLMTVPFRNVINQKCLVSFTEIVRSSCPCALTEHHAMKAYWGSGGIAPLIL